MTFPKEGVRIKMSKKIKFILIVLFTFLIFVVFITFNPFIEDALEEIKIMTYFESMFKLFLTFLLVAFIGYEREIRGRDAGLRTHLLVGMGSCLLMIVSVWLGELGADPARLAAQVVSGIGFLGAGTILKEGNYVKGLTTAASLWVAAAIGLAVGASHYITAFLTTFFVILTLFLLRFVENNLIQNNIIKKITLLAEKRSGIYDDINKMLISEGVNIRGYEIEEKDEETVLIRLELKFSPEYNEGELLKLFNNTQFIKRVKIIIS